MCAITIVLLLFTSSFISANHLVNETGGTPRLLGYIIPGENGVQSRLQVIPGAQHLLSSNRRIPNAPFSRSQGNDVNDSIRRMAAVPFSRLREHRGSKNGMLHPSIVLVRPTAINTNSHRQTQVHEAKQSRRENNIGHKDISENRFISSGSSSASFSSSSNNVTSSNGINLINKPRTRDELIAAIRQRTQEKWSHDPYAKPTFQHRSIRVDEAVLSSGVQPSMSSESVRLQSALSSSSLASSSSISSRSDAEWTRNGKRMVISSSPFSSSASADSSSSKLEVDSGATIIKHSVNLGDPIHIDNTGNPTKSLNRIENQAAHIFPLETTTIVINAGMKVMPSQTHNIAMLLEVPATSLNLNEAIKIKQGISDASTMPAQRQAATESVDVKQVPLTPVFPTEAKFIVTKPSTLEVPTIPIHPTIDSFPKSSVSLTHTEPEKTHATRVHYQPEVNDKSQSQIMPVQTNVQEPVLRFVSDGDAARSDVNTIRLNAPITVGRSSFDIGSTFKVTNEATQLVDPKVNDEVLPSVDLNINGALSVDSLITSRGKIIFSDQAIRKEGFFPLSRRNSPGMNVTSATFNKSTKVHTTPDVTSVRQAVEDIIQEMIHKALLTKRNGTSTSYIENLIEKSLLQIPRPTPEDHVANERPYILAQHQPTVQLSEELVNETRKSIINGLVIPSTQFEVIREKHLTLGMPVRNVTPLPSFTTQSSYPSHRKFISQSPQQQHIAIESSSLATDASAIANLDSARPSLFAGDWLNLRASDQSDKAHSVFKNGNQMLDKSAKNAPLTFKSTPAMWLDGSIRRVPHKKIDGIINASEGNAVSIQQDNVIINETSYSIPSEHKHSVNRIDFVRSADQFSIGNAHKHDKHAHNFESGIARKLSATEYVLNQLLRKMVHSNLSIVDMLDFYGLFQQQDPHYTGQTSYSNSADHLRNHILKKFLRHVTSDSAVNGERRPSSHDTVVTPNAQNIATVYSTTQTPESVVPFTRLNLFPIISNQATTKSHHVGLTEAFSTSRTLNNTVTTTKPSIENVTHALRNTISTNTNIFAPSTTMIFNSSSTTSNSTMFNSTTDMSTDYNTTMNTEYTGPTTMDPDAVQDMLDAKAEEALLAAEAAEAAAAEAAAVAAAAVEAAAAHAP